jgi:hypothetical protein
MFRNDDLVRTTGPPPANGDRGNGADHLLVGEDPKTASHVVATRWVRIYTDLILAKDSIIGELGAIIGRSLPEAAFELQQVDGSFLDAQRARYRRRLAFWERRKIQLERLRDRIS